MTSSSIRPPLAESLDLASHPEGGWYRRIFRSDVSVMPPGYAGERPAATAISYLLGAGDRSAWHRLRSGELWLWQGLGPVRLRLGGSESAPVAAEEFVLGAEPAAGQVLHTVVPPGTWQTAEPLTSAGGLVACVVAPGFDFADFELYRR